MSYCRWSSDDWRCMLYCYADVSGGYTTHVAASKQVGIENIPPTPNIPDDPEQTKAWAEAFVVAHDAQMNWMKTSKRVPIGLPYDGQTFNDPDLETFLARVVMLRAVGYYVPQWLLDSITDEINAAKSEGKSC